MNKYPGSLHCHSDFSNLRIRDSICTIKSLIDKAIELGHEVIAFTEHDTIANAIKIEDYYDEIKKTHPDFKVIRGNEIYLCRNGLNNSNFIRGKDRYYHFILLAKDAIGHKQIREISTRAWKRSYKTGKMRRVPTYYQDLIDIIGANKGHIIGSSACLGSMLDSLILRNKENPDEITESHIINWCKAIEEIFGIGNFYLELQPSASKEQTYVNQKLIELSNKMNIPYIITLDVHYLDKNDRSIHKAYLNSQDGEREVDAFYATTYMMDSNELESYLDLTREELDIAYNNIRTIAYQCADYTLKKPLRIPQLKWRPVKKYSSLEYQSYLDKIPNLSLLYNSEDNANKYLVNAIIFGIQSHPDLQNEEAYKELNKNIKTVYDSSNVNNASWASYFLNLQSNIDECWNAGTLVGPARGSGGGFLLLYCLDIIQMNKLREDTTMTEWRFLNPERVSVLDIDTDIEGSKRSQVLNHFRKVYGEDNVANVATFRTEKSKMSIMSAARGLGMDVDEAQGIAALIPSDRGQLRSLKQCYYGDEKNEWKPIASFVNAMNENPELWQVACRIEGLIAGLGVHAGGIIFVDEPFTESTGLCRAPDGTVCTAFDLHDSETVSLIKIDLLSVEAMDKIHLCLDLLCDYGYIKRESTLRETYEKTIGVYNLIRDDEKMWDMIEKHEILSLFQMEEQSGIHGISLIKPKSISDLAVLNSMIRLMAPDKDSEQPLDTWYKYRKDINIWIKELKDYGLTKEEIDWLKNYPLIHDGIVESQEGLMALVQEERLGGNSLNFADKCRKAIAKKQGKLFDECEQEFFSKIKEKNNNQTLANYVWNVLFKVQRGYSFNLAHTTAYSLIALQEMNLAYRFPIVFWNCACLINDAGKNDEDNNEDEDFYNEPESFENNSDLEVDEFDEDDDEEIESASKKKKKVKTTNYDKIAAAIGKMQSSGVIVDYPNINKSIAIFSPDPDNNLIRYGLSGIGYVNSDMIKEIINNRPYTSINDFLEKNKIDKRAMINLIKSGAFDALYPSSTREEIMHEYIHLIDKEKQKLNLQNFNALIENNLVPNELEFVVKTYKFTKILKKYFKSEDNFKIENDQLLTFYKDNYDVSYLINGNEISQKIYDKKIYQPVMDIAREWLKDNQEQVLADYNNILFMQEWNKYCLGNISSWEMDSISFYYHEHELKNINKTLYGVQDFNSLPEQPDIDYTFVKNGKTIPIYKLTRIVGTVIGKNKTKGLVTLLTTEGVVTVRFRKEMFAFFDKQISIKQEDGTKKVIEKSWFKKGNKIMLNGFRREDQFVVKKYAKTKGHQLYLITEVRDDGSLGLTGERISIESEED